MPEIAGFSHLSLSVRDVETSARFYCDTFGFAPLERLDNDRWLEVVLIHPTGVVMSIQQHVGNDGSRFDEVRTGLDHFALRTSTREELVAWVDELRRRGVTTSEVKDAHYGSVVTVRDPDDIQVELFFREDHP